MLPAPRAGGCGPHKEKLSSEQCVHGCLLVQVKSACTEQSGASWEGTEAGKHEDKAHSVDKDAQPRGPRLFGRTPTILSDFIES